MMKSGEDSAAPNTTLGMRMMAQSLEEEIQKESVAPVGMKSSVDTNPLPAILKERGERYGDFTDNALVAQALKDVLRAAVGWDKLRPVHREGADMICSKLSRIVTASPEYKDNWRDIAGFATITADRCKE